MKVRYVAVNKLTGYQFKTFRTWLGAQFWYSRSSDLAGMRIAHSSFADIYKTI